MSIVEADAPLDAAERAAIAGFATHYAAPRAACIDAMKLAQQNRGFISDAVLAEIAALLGMSLAELDEVATFYNLIFRRKVGAHVILLCDSISCWVLGCDAIAHSIAQNLGIRFGETTEDGRYTLLPTVCLGHCDHAPALMIGDTLHGDVNAARLSELLHFPERLPA